MNGYGLSEFGISQRQISCGRFSNVVAFLGRLAWTNQLTAHFLGNTKHLQRSLPCLSFHFVAMDMPVNVPVDDPNADTEWY